MEQTKSRSKSNNIQQVQCCVRRIFQKIRFCQKKKIINRYLKNGNFCLASTASSALTKTLINKDPFTNKDSLAHYLSYATLVTYVPVLGAEQFYFPCRVIFKGFCSNWFKLVSAQAQNSQTFNQKDIVVTIIKIFGPTISSSFDIMMSTALKDTRRQT